MWEKKAYWAHKFIVNLHFDVSAKKKMPEISGHVNGIIVWKQENDGPSLPPVDRTHQPSHLRGNMLASTPQVHNFGFQIYHSRVPKYSNEDS